MNITELWFRRETGNHTDFQEFQIRREKAVVSSSSVQKSHRLHQPAPLWRPLATAVCAPCAAGAIVTTATAS